MPYTTGLAKLAQLQQIAAQGMQLQQLGSQMQKQQDITEAGQAATLQPPINQQTGAPMAGPPTQITDPKTIADNYATNLEQKGLLDEATTVRKNYADMEFSQQRADLAQQQAHIKGMIGAYQTFNAGQKGMALKMAQKWNPDITAVNSNDGGKNMVVTMKGGQQVKVSMNELLRAGVTVDKQWDELNSNARQKDYLKTIAPPKTTKSDVEVLSAGLDVYDSVVDGISSLKGADRIAFAKDILDKAHALQSQAAKNGKILSEEDARLQAVTDLSKNLDISKINIGPVNIHTSATYTPMSTTTDIGSTLDATQKPSVYSSQQIDDFRNSPQNIAKLGHLSHEEAKKWLEDYSSGKVK